MKRTIFTPVPLRSRRDGWIAERQRAFVVALAEGRSPGVAATTVGEVRRSEDAAALRLSRAATRREALGLSHDRNVSTAHGGCLV